MFVSLVFTRAFDDKFSCTNSDKLLSIMSIAAATHPIAHDNGLEGSRRTMARKAGLDSKYVSAIIGHVNKLQSEASYLDWMLPKN